MSTEPEKQKLQGILTINVIEAKGLKSSALLGNPNPYLCLQIGKENFKTNQQEKTCDPKWQAKFTLPILKNMKLQTMLEFEVFDLNKFVSDSSLGYYQIDLGSAMKKINEQNCKLLDKQTLKQSDKYTGSLTILFVYQSLEAPDLNLNQSPANQQHKLARDQKYQGALRLTILSITNALLFKEANAEGFVQLNYMKNMKKTRNFKDRNPQVNEKFIFDIRNPNVDETVFTKFNVSVHNSLEGNSQSIGKILFDIQDIHDLEVNRPRSHLLTIVEKTTSAEINILMEVTFLHNGFIENPSGIVQVEVQKIDLNPPGVDIIIDYQLGSTEQLRCFDQSGHSFQIPTYNIEMEIPYRIYTHRKIQEYIKNPAALTQLEPEAYNALRFAELNWINNPDDPIEFYTQTRLLLPSKKCSVTVYLKLIYRHEKVWNKKKQYHDKDIEAMRKSRYMPDSKYSTPSSRKASEIAQKAMQEEAEEEEQKKNKETNQGKTAGKSRFAQQKDVASEGFTKALTITDEDDEKKKQDANDHQAKEGETPSAVDKEPQKEEEKVDQQQQEPPKHEEQVVAEVKRFAPRQAVLLLKSITLSGLDLTAVGKPQLYFQVCVKDFLKQYFTYSNEDPFTFHWNCELPILVQKSIKLKQQQTRRKYYTDNNNEQDDQEDEQQILEFRLYDVNLNFDEGNDGGGTGHEHHVFAPKSVNELLIFRTTYKQFHELFNKEEGATASRVAAIGDANTGTTGVNTEPANSNTGAAEPKRAGLKQLVITGNAELSPQFMRQIEGFNFMTGDKKVSLAEIKRQAENTAQLSISFQGWESAFISEPCGSLTLSMTKLDGIIMVNNKQVDPRIIVTLSEQTYQFQEPAQMANQYTWNQKCQFACFNVFDVLRLQILDAGTSRMRCIADIVIPLATLPFPVKETGGDQPTLIQHVENIAQYSFIMAGRLTLTLTYCPFGRHPYYNAATQGKPILESGFWGKEHAASHLKTPQLNNNDNNNTSVLPTSEPISFQKYKQCRIILRLSLDSFRLPELKDSEKFILEIRLGKQKAYSSYQYSNKCKEYPCLPQEKMEFSINPHDHSNKILQFSLKVFSVKQHGNGDNNKEQTLLYVLMSACEWCKFPLTRSGQNFYQTRLQYQGVVAKTSTESSIVRFRLDLLDSSAMQMCEYGQFQVGVEQLRCINFDIPHGQLDWRTNAVYLLRLASQDMSFSFPAKIAPLALGRNITFMRNKFLDCDCVITNLEYFSAIDRNLIMKQKTLTFNDSCSFFIKSFDTVITATIYLIQDTEIKDDAKALKIRQVDDMRSAHVIYKGFVNVREVLSLLQKPDQSTPFAIKLYREQPQVLYTSNETISSKSHMLQEETYLILKFKYETFKEVFSAANNNVQQRSKQVSQLGLPAAINEEENDEDNRSNISQSKSSIHQDEEESEDKKSKKSEDINKSFSIKSVNNLEAASGEQQGGGSKKGNLLGKLKQNKQNILRKAGKGNKDSSNQLTVTNVADQQQYSVSVNTESSQDEIPISKVTQGVFRIYLNSYTGLIGDTMQGFATQVDFKAPQAGEKNAVPQMGDATQFGAVMERSSKVYNPDYCIFQEMLTSMYSPSQLDLPITVTKFVIERAGFGKGSTSAANVILFRQILQQHSLSLQQYECCLGHPLHVQLDARPLQSQSQTKLGLLNFSLTLLSNKLTYMPDGFVIIQKIEIPQLYREDFEGTGTYFHFRIGRTRDFKEQASFACHYQGQFAEVPMHGTQAASQTVATKGGSIGGGSIGSNNTVASSSNQKNSNHPQQLSVTHPDAKEHPADIKYVANDFTDTEDSGMYNTVMISLQLKSVLDFIEVNLCDANKKDIKVVSKHCINLLDLPLPLADASPEESKRPIICEFILFYFYRGKLRPFRIRLTFMILSFTESIEIQGSRRISMQNVSMLKSKMVQQKESHLRNYYYDSKYTIFEFHQDFRKKFKGISIAYINDQFSTMTQTLQNNGFKSLLNAQIPAADKKQQKSKSSSMLSAFSNRLLHFSLPRGNTLILKGTFYIKFSMNIRLRICFTDPKRQNQQQLKSPDVVPSSSQQSSHRQLIGGSVNPSSDSQEPSIVIPDRILRLRMHSYNFEFKENREEDDMEVESTEIKFMDDIDFYVEESVIKKCFTVFLEFEYKDKEDETRIEQGEIDKKILNNFTSITEDKDLFQSQFIIVLLKPSNLKLFFGCQVIRSPYIDNPLGRTTLRIHRIIKYDDDMFHEAKTKNKPVDYKNNYLLVKLKQEKEEPEQKQSTEEAKNEGNTGNENGQKITSSLNINERKSVASVIEEQDLEEENNISIFAKTQMKLKIKCNEQYQCSDIIDNKGCLQSDYFKTYEFLTSHFFDKFDFQLQLTQQSQELTAQQLLKQQQDQQLQAKNSNNNDDEFKEHKLEDFISDTRDINLCVGKLYLSDLILPLTNEEQQHFFICQLYSMKYHQNDLLKEFLEILDRENLWVLGSVQFFNQEWFNVCLDIVEVRAIQFNLNHPNFQLQEDEGDIHQDGEDEAPENQERVQTFKKMQQQQLEDTIFYFSLHSKVYVQLEKGGEEVLSEYNTSLKSMTYAQILKEEEKAKEERERKQQEFKEKQGHQDTEEDVYADDYDEKKSKQKQPVFLDDENSYGATINFGQQELVSNIYVKHTEGNCLMAEFQFKCMVNGEQKIIGQKIYPLQHITESGRYTKNQQQVLVPLDDKDVFTKKEDLMIKCDMVIHPTLVLKAICLSEINPTAEQLNPFGEAARKLEPAASKAPAMDFRKTKLSEMLVTLINTTDKQTMMQVLNEINEMLIYLDYKQYKKHYPLCLEITINLLKVYKDEIDIFAQLAQNTFSLIMVDLDYSLPFIKGQKALQLFAELSEYIMNLDDFGQAALLQYANQQQLLYKTTFNGRRPESEQPKLYEQALALLKQQPPIIEIEQESQIRITDVTDQLTRITQEYIESGSITTEDIIKIIQNNRKEYLQHYQQKLNKRSSTLFSRQQSQLLGIGGTSTKGGSISKLQQQQQEMQSLQQNKELRKNYSRAALYIVKIVETFISKNIDNSIEMLDYFPIYNQLVLQFLSAAENMGAIFTIIIKNMIDMTGFELGEQKITDAFFSQCLDVICTVKRFAQNTELSSIINSSIAMYSYICFKKNQDVMVRAAFSYYEILFYALKVIEDRRDIISDIMVSILESTSLLSVSKDFIECFQILCQKENVIETCESLFKSELLYQNAKLLNEKKKQSGKEVFNEDLIFESILKLLMLMVKDYNFPQSMFDKLIKFIKDRLQTIKNQKRKSLLDSFLSFIFTKEAGGGLSKLEQQKKKDNQQSKQQKGEDLVTLKNQLATKYLISKLDWQK